MRVSLKRAAWLGMFAGAAVMMAGCSSDKRETPSSAVPAIPKNAPAVLKSCTLGIAPIEDSRPVGNSFRLFATYFSRPEIAGFKLVNLQDYFTKRLGETGIFGKVATVQPSGKTDFVLVIRQKTRSVDMESWIPFVFRLRITFIYDLELVNGANQVVWRYSMSGTEVNYPSDSEVQKTFNAAFYEERMLDKVFPSFVEELCLFAAGNPELFAKKTAK